MSVIPINKASKNAYSKPIILNVIKVTKLKILITINTPLTY